jgi:hypothetical protein
MIPWPSLQSCHPRGSVQRHANANTVSGVALFKLAQQRYTLKGVIHNAAFHVYGGL